MERPSTALIIAFCLAQLVSSIIAAFGNWGFTQIKAISGGWIGIVWVWVWFFFVNVFAGCVDLDFSFRTSSGLYPLTGSSLP